MTDSLQPEQLSDDYATPSLLLADLEIVRRHIEESAWSNKPLCRGLVNEVESLRGRLALAQAVVEAAEVVIEKYNLGNRVWMAEGKRLNAEVVSEKYNLGNRVWMAEEKRLNDALAALRESETE